ncbi:MAG: DUF1553 domain-containing protein [Pirellulaceae bacterium]|nr:DUF1553 domain-containing protein [Planctomycetales bacterium]
MTRKIVVKGLPAAFLVIWTLVFGERVSSQEQITFSRDIQPLISDRCLVCHGPDASANTTGLRLDIAVSALGELPGGEGRAFVAGDLEQSVAWQRMTSDDSSYRMPPIDSGLGLSTDEITKIRQWIMDGARYEQHWSLRPIDDNPSKSVAADEAATDAWQRATLDRLVLARLKAEGLGPSPEAERWRWLRRVTLDLTGLPPTAEELESFQQDALDGAYDRVVDRLLASPHFGEHMAIAWLDAARYADSYGYQSDQLSPTWPYRDWVVRAFNENLPYDRFLTQQLAGDLLPDATADQILATAFNRLHRQTNEGGSIEEEWRTEYAADRVHTFGSAMLGMTLECARCHDHKYDTISQRDYYGLFAFFNNIDEWGTYHDSSRVPTPTLLLPDEPQQQVLLQTERERSAAEGHYRAAVASLTETFPQWHTSFRAWTVDLQPSARFSLDEITAESELRNDIDAKMAGKTSVANEMVEGYRGNALRLTGDDAAEFPNVAGGLNAWDRYTIACWLLVPSETQTGVIIHRQGGTDVGFFGTELGLYAGRLRFSTARFWPGNAIAIETVNEVPTDCWIHVAMVNDGSGRAAGMQLYVNGQAENRLLRDNLEKAPAAGGTGFVVGERFRSPGFKNGRIDEIVVFDLPLSRVEIVAQKNQWASVDKDQFVRDDWLQFYASRDEKCQAAAAIVAETAQKFLEARTPVLETMVMREMPTRRDTYVLARGQYDAPKTEDRRVDCSTPAAIGTMPVTYPQNRLGLAMWLTNPNHPLAARVAVNRIWQNFFEHGLVATANDFGRQGSLPTHPELLDYLARQFIESGWDTKALCRRIVLSATYRQTSACSLELRRRDPENDLLARGPSRRLSAEMIRDLALSSSGLMSREVGGPPVSPYQPPNLWRENNSMTPAYRQSVGKALYRRSLYTVWKRTTPMPNMLVFDATSRETCTMQRPSTNTPMQALVLLNDIQFVEAARVLAEQAMKASPDDIDQRIHWIFRRLAGRPCDAFELQTLHELYDTQVADLQQDSQTAKALLANGESPPAKDVPAASAAATMYVVQAVLNADATIWKR